MNNMQLRLFLRLCACFAIACACFPARAAGPLWIPLGDADSIGKEMIDIDYNSIRLDGARPVMLLRVKLKDPMRLHIDDPNDARLTGDAEIHALVMRSEADCAGATIELRQASFLDAAGRVVKTLDRAAYDRVKGHQRVLSSMPIDTMKALCIWRDLGFHVPDLSTGGNWEEIPSNNPPSALFEAPERRQYAKGMVLIYRKTDWMVTLSGRQSRLGMLVSVYDCAKAESHTTALVRYDLDGLPIFGSLYKIKPDTPVYEANRKRFADACNDPRAR